MASFVHVRLGPTSVHLLLNGLLGLLLGWAALPALAVALFLQSVLLGHGGLTALGANVLGMGLPGVVIGIPFSYLCRRAGSTGLAMGWGALAGGLSVLLTAAAFATFLHVSDPQAYALTIRALVVAHVPIVFLEAGVTGAAIGLVRRVHPELLAFHSTTEAAI